MPPNPAYAPQKTQWDLRSPTPRRGPADVREGVKQGLPGAYKPGEGEC
jgi:hypothetical protein